MSRLLTGAWTHAGYLNWDTGHGRLRWHSGQYWAFAQQGLLAIAASPELWSRRAYGRWAKALFDRGLGLYERWAAEAGGVLAPQLPFGVWSAHRDQDLYAARMAANAARAVVLGLGRMRATDPPPLYAFDRDSGRLAVTTPRYSTAIVPDNNGAFAVRRASSSRGCSAPASGWRRTSAACRRTRSASSRAGCRRRAARAAGCGSRSTPRFDVGVESHRSRGGAS